MDNQCTENLVIRDEKCCKEVSSITYSDEYKNPMGLKLGVT